MKQKKYKAEQVGLLWMLTGEDITGAEIFANLTDIPSRFFDSLEIIPEKPKRSKSEALFNPKDSREMNAILDLVEKGGAK
jgi:hypothetical protein